MHIPLILSPLLLRIVEWTQACPKIIISLENRFTCLSHSWKPFGKYSLIFSNWVNSNSYRYAINRLKCLLICILRVDYQFSVAFSTIDIPKSEPLPCWYRTDWQPRSEQSELCRTSTSESHWGSSICGSLRRTCRGSSTLHLKVSELCYYLKQG